MTTKLQDLEAKRLEADIALLEARRLHEELRAESLQRDFELEDSDLLNQRIYPFIGEVKESSVHNAMDGLASMSKKSKRPITIWFNSPGGSLFDGLALFDYILTLRARGIKVTTVAFGMAASMAGILLQAGDTRLVGPSSHILIHEVSTLSFGKASDLEDEVLFIKRLQRRCLDILSERSSMSPTQIARKWKRKDWWLDANEAITLGFADGFAK